MNHTAMITRATAANHSYTLTAIPTKKPSPLIPMNCSAEIFDAMSEAPIAHHASEPSARKKVFCISSFFLFLVIYPKSVTGNNNDVGKEYE